MSRNMSILCHFRVLGGMAPCPPESAYDPASDHLELRFTPQPEVAMTLRSQSGTVEPLRLSLELPSSPSPDPREASDHLELRHTLQLESR